MFYIIVFFLCFCAGKIVSTQEIPDYIHVCKRDQSTINDCVRNSIETLRPKLADGIPELNVPGIEPFFISELVVDSGDLVHFHALGKDVEVSGASNFTIKTISVDLDTLTIRGRVRFPKLHFNGRYRLDSRILAIALQGQGNIVADAVRCDAELTMRSALEERDGVEYIKFTALDVNINVKDYRVKLDGLFNGEKNIGEVANQAINQNRAEFLRASKPYVEKTVSKLLLDTANKIAGTFPLKDLLPEP